MSKREGTELRYVQVSWSLWSHTYALSLRLASISAAKSVMRSTRGLTKVSMRGEAPSLGTTDLCLRAGSLAARLIQSDGILESEFARSAGSLLTRRKGVSYEMDILLH